MGYQLGLIGGGNMAEAILRGLLGAGFLMPSEVIVSEVLPARRAHLEQLLGVATTDDGTLPAACPRVLLAVKPQMMAPVLAQIAPHVQADATVISIAAGIRTSVIDKALNGRGRIVRVMPNTPMLVGAGASAVAAGPRAQELDIDWATRLFAASGTVAQVEESMIDAVTAVSGSGPAYFFYLVEAMVQAGVAEGLDLDVALELARQTCVGAGKLLAESQEKPETLRARVTSPNGTTQRAIETMDAANVKASLVKAIRAAADRSRELGK